MNTDSTSEQVEYNWIDVEILRSIPSRKNIVLFGAGQGSIELIHANNNIEVPFHIKFITDNDPTMWNKHVSNLEIIPPSGLKEIPDIFIIVTTISGKESVSRQLETMGYRLGRDFLTAGKFPINSLENIKLFLEYNQKHSLAKPHDAILHIGPGGFLGLECCLHSLGYSVCSIDANGFGIQYPDVSNARRQYATLFEEFLSLDSRRTGKNVLEERFSELFTTRDSSVFIDTSKIPFLFPHRFSSMPLEDESVNVIMSFAVLEHVHNPSQSISEMWRVLKPGGFAFHKIVTQDHRSFSKVSGYHPFSYLEHSEQEWNEINKNKFYQNRLLPSSWKRLFSERFEIKGFETLNNYVPSDRQYDAIQRTSPNIRRSDLTCYDCVVLAKKNAA